MAKRKKKKTFINPAEEAYEAGRSTVTAEEAIGLPKREKPKKKKGSRLRRISRLVKMATLGSRYKGFQPTGPSARRY